ncbi:Probable tRNA (uracil-O(2)-)-methyltransferase [Gryllus bimaculatus]|nr:Probable tRNA (uracil-O(2)-)-methyltransferase [Gryllus bimaculatus]
MESSPDVILCRSPLEDISQYQQAVERWHRNPHYVNRRISTSVPLFTAKVQHPERSHDLLGLIIKCEMTSNMEITCIIDSLKQNGMVIKNENSSEDNTNYLNLEIRKLLPRYNKVFKEMLQITISDSIPSEYIFIGLPYGKGVISSPLAPVYPFSIQFVNEEMLLVIFGINAVNDKAAVWLKECLFPKLQRWSEENPNQSSPGIESLSLIYADQYSVLYQNLKEKYGQKFVEIWSERTDPQKFVYEDVAIATYLLLLWEAQRSQQNRPNWKQSFVDMGCGNGLLVYILNSEGHPGLGVDVRKRGIWDLYPSSTQLKVQTFVPSNCNTFPEADWIIGNHSDELTPWIPVIASKSSYKCSFFLLPCCAYVFSGHKYQRQDSSRSQYSEYLDYIKTICEKCGFVTKFDRLKIPSTKRICLVGSERNYLENNFKDKQREIIEFIQTCSEVPEESSKISSESTHSSIDSCSSEMWTSHFIAREAKEEVRNCTKIKEGISNKIIDIVVQMLLAENNLIPVKGKDGKEKMWNAGCCVKLGDVAALLPKKLLLELKKECGGLQTLLRNNHEIFSVISGSVKLSRPATVEEKVSRFKNNKRKVEIKLKQKPCWFFNFHPDGCPLNTEECSFCH